MYAAADESDAPARFARMYTYFLAGFGWIGVVLALVSPPVVAVLTPKSYWDGTAVIPIVVLAYVLHAAYAIVGNAIYKSGRTLRLAGALVLATAVNLVLNALLIPAHGMMGAAIATLGAYLVLVAVTGLLAHRDFPVPYEWGRLLRIVIAGGLGYAPCAMIAGELGTATPWLAAGLGAVLYPALLVLTGVIRWSDVARLRELTRRLRRRTAAGSRAAT
jgi:O-antigen/teichoic acid export membrane protein